MGATTAATFEFDCPACRSEMRVDADVREEILADGCVLCRTPVTDEAFARAPRND
jgi:hypothetical protein